MLRRTLAIMRREYLERVRTRAFWLSTVLVPVFLLAVLILPSWYASRGSGSFRIAVLDQPGAFFAPLQQRVEELSRERARGLEIELQLHHSGTDPVRTREQLKQQVQEGTIQGLLVLPETLTTGGEPEYVAPNVAAFRLIGTLERAVSDVVIRHRLVAAGLESEQIGTLTRRVVLRTVKLGKQGEEAQDRGSAFMLSYFFVFMLYLSVLLYGVSVMRSVLEEKQSHVVEVIIATVRPFELLLGKILGVGAVGLSQILLWSLLIIVVSIPSAAAAVGLGSLDLPTIPLLTVVFLVVFFVLGFLLFGTLYAAVGAAFDSEQDAQQLVVAVSMLMVIPIALLVNIAADPDGTLAVVLSLIPFFTPMLMFLRITLTQVSPLELAASVLLLVGTIALSTWLAAKVYAVGILTHGTKPKLKDLLLWLRQG